MRIDSVTDASICLVQDGDTCTASGAASPLMACQRSLAGRLTAADQSYDLESTRSVEAPWEATPQTDLSLYYQHATP